MVALPDINRGSLFSPSCGPDGGLRADQLRSAPTVHCHHFLFERLSLSEHPVSSILFRFVLLGTEALSL